MAISPQLAEHSRAQIEDRKLTFDILADPGNRLAEIFGLKFQLPEDLRGVYRELFEIHLDAYNGDVSWTLPMPARYVIDSMGKVQAAEVNPDYTRRPEPEETLAIVVSLQQGQAAKERDGR